MFALSLLACASVAEDEAASSEAELGVCATAGAVVTASAGLWLRAAPSTSGALVHPSPMPLGAKVVRGGSIENGFARVTYASPEGASLTGWASTQWLECRSSAPAPVTTCPDGQARHAYARGGLVTVTLEDGSPYVVPAGQKMLVAPESAPGPRMTVRVPTFDRSGATVEVSGRVDAAAVQLSASCTDSGILQRARTGATKLLGQYDFDRGGWSGQANQRNAVLGLDRVDGAVVASTKPFVYLDRIADDRQGSQTCASDTDCDGASVCHQRGRCGAYHYGVSTSGDELWASGVCGTATTVHRAALDAALVPVAYTTHGHFFSSNQFPGADAEVYWSAAGPPAQGQHYKFANDTLGEIVLVGGARLVGGRFVTTVQIWGTVSDGRYSEFSISQGGEKQAVMTYTITRPAGASTPAPRPETATIQRTAASGAAETWQIRSNYWRDEAVSVPVTTFKSRNHPDR